MRHAPRNRTARRIARDVEDATAYLTSIDSRHSSSPRRLSDPARRGLPRPLHDFADHVGLRIRILLHEVPGRAAEIPLRTLVELAIAVVGAKPVAEQLHLIDFRTALRENVQI